MTNYSIDIQINNLDKSICCDVQIKIAQRMDQISMMLYKGFNIKNIYSEGKVVTFKEIDDGMQFMPYSKTIILNQSNLENIRLNYSGKLEGEVCDYNNKIDEDFFLLTDYAPWYPVLKQDRNAYISSEIKGVSDYKILNGIYNKENKCWNMNGQMLVGVKNYLIESINFRDFEFSVIYYHPENKNEARKCTEIVKDCIRYFTKEIFNKNLDWKTFHYFNPKTRINDGWSFIRDNIIVSQEELFNNEIKMASLMAHEIAHNWCKGAEFNWEDWLNESFAEYAACLYLENRYGYDQYKNKINFHVEVNNKHFSDESIRPKSGESRPDSVHTKGVILLDKVRNIYGKKTVLRVISIFINLQQKTTKSLLSKIKHDINPALSSWLNNMLDKPF